MPEGSKKMQRIEQFEEKLPEKTDYAIAILEKKDRKGHDKEQALILSLFMSVGAGITTGMIATVFHLSLILSSLCAISTVLVCAPLLFKFLDMDRKKFVDKVRAQLPLKEMEYRLLRSKEGFNLLVHEYDVMSDEADRGDEEKKKEAEKLFLELKKARAEILVRQNRYNFLAKRPNGKPCRMDDLYAELQKIAELDTRLQDNELNETQDRSAANLAKGSDEWKKFLDEAGEDELEKRIQALMNRTDLKMD